MPRPMVLIGDRDTPSARVLRRQTFFGELVPEASGAAMPIVYEEDDYPSPEPGFSSRRLKGDRQWLEGGSAAAAHDVGWRRRRHHELLPRLREPLLQR